MHCYSTIALYLITILTGLFRITLVDAYAIPLRRVHLPAASGRPALSVVRFPRHEGEHGSAPSPEVDSESEIPVTTVTITQTVTSSTTVSTSTVTSTVIATTTVTDVETEVPTTTTTSTPTTTSTTETTSTSTSTTDQQPEQTPAPGGPGAKLVVAHHMVGNTFPYTKQDWLDDIRLAHRWGIDGFALNTGKDVDWEPARIADAYAAAEESKLDFKLFLSLDMASLPCTAPEHATYLRTLVLKHAEHPNQLKHDDRAFVSTFAGENCLFGGGGEAPDAWRREFTQHPEIKGKVYFVPSFFIDPKTFGKFGGVMDGDFNWNSGWPLKATTDFAKEVLGKLSEKLKDTASQRTGGPPVRKPISPVVSAGDVSDEAGAGLKEALGELIGSTESDDEHRSGLQALNTENRRDESGNPTYMASVSPWFFTHYGADSFNKNFIFLADQHLYVKRWESLIKSRDQLDIVQVLTWNDYGESHYIGPIKGAQPNSEAWTDGMDHTAWLELTKYYAKAFKTGEFPKIEKDQIYMWSRPHAANAQAPDPVGQPKNFELSEDTVWAVVFTTAPSKVRLSTGSASSELVFDVEAGVSKLAIPITPGGTMKGTIEREGKVVLELAPSGEEFTFQGSPQTYNFNAFVARAVAEPPSA